MRFWITSGTGVSALVLLQLPWYLGQPSWAARGFTLTILASAIARPHIGLLIFAALSPLTTALAPMLGASAGWALLVELALTAATGVYAHRPDQPPTAWMPPALALVAGIAAASAAVQLPPVLALQGDLSVALANLAREFLTGSFEATRAPWPPLVSCWVIITAAALAAATERAVRTAAALASSLLTMSLVGHAAGAALNLNRLVMASLQSGQFRDAFLDGLVHMRVSLQTDYNAAASAFVLVLLAATGIGGSRQRRMTAMLLQLVVLLGIWMTSSRAALLAAVLAPLITWGWRLSRTFRRPWLVLGGLAGSAAVLSALFFMAYPAGRNDTVRGSLSSRLVLARAGIEMFRSAPAFGVGLSAFYATSERVVGPDLVAIAGSPRENAHNNFIQVLAEEGIIGLAALLIATGALLWRAARKAGAPTWANGFWLATGVLGAMLTWLTGHPLLAPEFSLVFWFFCGMLAGSLDPPRSRRWSRWLLAATALVLATLPLRLIDARDRADLEHQGLALSAWRHDDDQRYRSAGRSFSVFLPAGAPVTLPIRRSPGMPDLLVAFAVRGESLNVVRLSDDSWRNVGLFLRDRGRKFERVDFVVTFGDGGSAASDDRSDWVRVGRAH